MRTRRTPFFKNKAKIFMVATGAIPLSDGEAGFFLVVITDKADHSLAPSWLLRPQRSRPSSGSSFS
jgi:hypothetical protein